MVRLIIYTLIVLNLAAFLWFYNKTPVDLGKQTAEITPLLNSDRIKLVAIALNDQQPQAKKLSISSEQTDPEMSDNAEAKIETNVTEQIKENNHTLESSELSVQSLEQESIKVGSVLAEETTLILEQPRTKARPDNRALIEPVTVESIKKGANDNLPERSVSKKETTTLAINKTLSEEEQKLLSEMASFSKAIAEEKPIEAVAVKPVSIEKICYQYGPLKAKQAKAISQSFRQLNIPVVEQSRINTEAAGYLVLINPMATVAQAKQKMKQAKNAGLDAFTITKGKWLHGISLGIFSEKANADFRLNRAKKLLPKTSIEVKKRFREVSVFRLIFSLDDDENPTDLLSNSTFPTIDTKNPPKVAKKSCKSVEF